MSEWVGSIDAEPGVYRVVLALPDGRWWSAYVQANSFAEASDEARRVADLPDAPVVCCDFTSAPLPVRVLNAEVVTPRGWVDADEREQER